MKIVAFYIEIEGISEKKVQNRPMFNSVKKKKGLIGFLNRTFGIGYEVVESKLYHKKGGITLIRGGIRVNSIV